MKLIEFEAVMLFFAVIFSILGITDWITGYNYPGLFLTSLLFLLAKNIIETIDRLRVNGETDAGSWFFKK